MGSYCAGFYYRNLSVSTVDLQEIAGSLRNDTSIVVDLWNQYSSVITAILNISGSIAVLEQTLESLEAELAIHKGVQQ